MLKIELLKRKKQLEEYISRIEPWLKKKPDKTLSVTKRTVNGKTYYRYLIFGEGELSIKEDYEQIKMLTKKHYYSKVLEAAKDELSTINLLLKKIEVIPNTYVSMHEGRKLMVKPLEEPVKVLVRRFLQEKYPPSEYEIKYPSDTLKGEVVRSWPEALIANVLFENEIPYRYERPFTLYNGHTVRPDFTVMHPLSGELFIWEHLGLTEKESYKTIAIKKIKDYALSNMLLGKNLIVTFDNDEYKLTRKELQQIIEVFFK